MASPTMAPSALYEAPEYSSGQLVRDLHRYPHVNDADDFNVDSGGDYIYAIQYMFLATVVIGMLAIVAQWLIFCCELCWRCCNKCCSFSNFCFQITLSFAFLWLLLGTGLSYWGRNSFQDGADKIFDIATELKSSFSSMESLSSDLVDYAVTVDYAADRVNCLSSSIDDAYAERADDFTDAANLAFDSVDGIADDAQRVARLFEKQIPKYIDYGIGFLTGLMAMTVFVGFWSIACGSLAFKKRMMAISSIVLVLFCPIIAFELTLSVVVSDFCVGLDTSFNTVVNKYAPDESHELLQYYTSCNGTNPMDTYLNQSLTALEQLDTAVEATQPPICSNQQALDNITAVAGQANSTISELFEYVACSQINPLISKLLYSVLCTDVIQGLYRLWVVQLTCAISLWVLLFIVQCHVEEEEDENKEELAVQESRLGIADKLEPINKSQKKKDRRDEENPSGVSGGQEMEMARRQQKQAKHKSRLAAPPSAAPTPTVADKVRQQEHHHHHQRAPAHEQKRGHSRHPSPQRREQDKGGHHKQRHPPKQAPAPQGELLYPENESAVDV